MGKLKMKCSDCGFWNTVPVNKVLVEQPTSEPKVKAYVAMDEPLQAMKCKKCARYPVKGILPGQSQISPRLVAMLNRLPKQEKRIFPMTYDTARNIFTRVKKRAASKLQNPCLLNVSFKSYRHWGGSMLAHYTNGNVLTIKKFLRHKSVLSTMKYIHTIDFKDEDFETTASTTEEIRELGKAGWTKYDEMNGLHFYRKPKRFGGSNSVGLQ